MQKKEEADILSDRIAIMAKGKFRCIGTSIRLKSRFGTGYIANVNFSATSTAAHMHGLGSIDDPHLEPVKRFFYEIRLGVNPKEENKAFLTFVIPRDKEALLTFLCGITRERESEFGISDIQLGLTTLEEVFLNIAKQADADAHQLDSAAQLAN
ncbi:ABC transporter A family member 2 isoform X2 [Carex littledalei]|uniref:ABC transporter A family member 2 isoform X2 n=1 Tax=Carex littledalei TaxID=544730 RepID=A0A833W1X9_9POAL|nr:ABC transporter A family member 2 isoform X2 [Carex littledalei]